MFYHIFLFFYYYFCYSSFFFYLLVPELKVKGSACAYPSNQWGIL